MGTSRRLVIACIFSCLVAGLLLDGCDGCHCGRRPNAPVTPPAGSGAAVADASNVSPAGPAVSPVDPLDRLSRAAAMLPADVKWVAVFDPIRLRDLLHKVSRVAPKLTRSRDFKDVQARILDLYGVDMSKVQGPCLFAGLGAGGRLLVCSAVDAVVTPVDASIWTVGDYRGPVVFRRESRVSLGAVDGRLVAGDENAVFAAVSHYIARQPSLAQLLKRKNSLFRELAADDAWNGIALFFPGTMDPGWCPPDMCRGTALFGGTDRFVVVSIANGLDNTVKVRELMEESWRSLVLVPWEAARANPRIPPDYLRDGDRPVSDNSYGDRADRVIFTANGDLLDVLSVLRIGDIDWLLGL